MGPFYYRMLEILVLVQDSWSVVLLVEIIIRMNSIKEYLDHDHIIFIILLLIFGVVDPKLVALLGCLVLLRRGEYNIIIIFDKSPPHLRYSRSKVIDN